MEKIIHIRQPAYLPALVFFDQMIHAEQNGAYVIYDNVQYERRHYGNRNRLRTQSGWQWITVPVIQKGKRSQHYLDTKINNEQPWGKAHWGAIKTNYAKAPYFKDYSDFFEELYKRKWESIVDLDLATITFIQSILGITTQIVRASELLTSTELEKNNRLVEIVKELGGTTYITVKGTQGYIEPEVFKNAKLNLLWHQFKHPIYPQIHGGEFVPYMSAIDLLFNCGDRSGQILRDNVIPATPTP